MSALTDISSKSATRDRWIMGGRVLFLAIVSLVAGVFSDFFPASTPWYLRPIAIVVAVICLNISYVLWMRTGKYPGTLRMFQIVADILIAFITVWLTGQLSSPFLFFYPVAIIVACLMDGRRGGTVSAVFATFIFSVSIFLDMKTLIFRENNLFLYFLNILAFNLTAILGSMLSSRISAAEAKLTKVSYDLQRVEAIQRHLAQSLVSGFMAVDKNGIILTVNPAAKEILGYKESLLTGNQIGSFLPEVAICIKKVCSGAQPCARMETEYHLQDGSMKIIGISGFFLKDDQGGDLGFGMIFQDLTDAKKKQEQMQRMDRLASLGEMAAGLAHELRTPVASILGAAQFIEEQGMISEDGQSLINIISRESQRLKTLTESILQYARPEKGKTEQLYLKNEVEITLTLLARKKNIANAVLDISIPDDLYLELNPIQFRQVMFNLLQNAYQSIPEEQQGLISVEAYTEEGGIRIDIQDNGKGIDQKDLKQIFDPFFTTRADGTGLGLSIVSRLVETWGGKISCDSTPEIGTRFSIFIPGANRQS